VYAIYVDGFCKKKKLFPNSNVTLEPMVTFKTVSDDLRIVVQSV